MLTFSLNKNINNVLTNFNTKVFKPTTDDGREWLSTLVFNALENKVENNVDANAYGYVCEQNTKMAKSKKETALLTEEERENKLKGVKESVASYLDMRIEDVIEDMEGKDLVKQFTEMHEYLIVEEGVNLWKIVTLVYEYNNRAIEKLQFLMKEYRMEELIQGIIAREECIAALEILLDYPIARKYIA